MRNLRYRKLNLANDTWVTGKNEECLPKRLCNISPRPSGSLLPSFTWLSNLSITLGPYSPTWSPPLTHGKHGLWSGVLPHPPPDTCCSFPRSCSQTPTSPSCGEWRYTDDKTMPCPQGACSAQGERETPSHCNTVRVLLGVQRCCRGWGGQGPRLNFQHWGH